MLQNCKVLCGSDNEAPMTGHAQTKRKNTASWAICTWRIKTTTLHMSAFTAKNILKIDYCTVKCIYQKQEMACIAYLPRPCLS